MNRALGCLLMAVSLGLPAHLRATPTVGPISASPPSIKAGISTAVTVTVQITDPTVIAGGVNLLQVDASGNTLSILGVMTDSGKGAFTLTVSFDPPSPGQIYLQASAAFKGILQRVKSAVLTIPVSGNGGPFTITDFNPKSGPIGTLVKISLNNFTPISGSAPQVTLSSLNGGAIAAPVSSFAANTISFVIPAGAGTGKVTVQSGTQSATSSASLSTTISSTFTLNAGPSGASLLQGQSVTYAVTVNSSDGFDGLAALTVAGAPSGVTAVFNPGAITAGQTSILTVSAPITQPVSTATLTFSAAATIDGQPVSETATGTLQIVPVTTSFLGRTVVDDTQETPIAGVTVKFLGQDGSGHTTPCSSQTTSDAAGNFALTNLSSGCTGPQLISYDGLTATSPAGKYAGVNLEYPLKPGQVTTSPVLIRLPRIDDKETVMVKQNSSTDQVFTFQTIPGLVVTVYAGTTFSLEDGTQPEPFPLIAINIPVDRLPDRMPPSALVTPFVVAFQPANAVSSQPVAVNYPNPLNVAPGTHATLMTLDPTRGLMVPYGTATVSANGTEFLADADPNHPDHAYGLVHFDWHAPALIPPAKKRCPECIPPPPGVMACPLCAQKKDPIDLASGLEVLEETDMAIGNARGAVSLTRTYRTLNNNPGPFGIGTNHNYGYTLDTATPLSQTVINLVFPDGSPFPFVRTNATQLVNTGTPMLLGAVLTTNADSTSDLRWKDGSIWHFVARFGRGIPSGSYLTAQTDTNGNVTTIMRSPTMQVIQVTDPVGRSLQFAYDASNRITSVNDPLGRKVQYAYNAQGTLANVTDPEGGVTQYEYDAQNRLTKVTDPRNIVAVQNVYDANGAVVQQTQADGGVTTFNYTLQDPTNPNSFNTQTIVTDPLKHSTTYRFDSSGFLLSVTDAAGQIRSFARAPGTNLIASISGKGSCDICGDPASGDSTFTYDVLGNLTSSTDGLGQTTQYTYDPIFNKIASVTDPLGNKTTLLYDAHGDLASITDPNHNSTTLSYDSYGEVVSVNDALNNQTTLQYDFGNLTSVTDPLNHKTSMAYDAVSRLIQVQDALGRSTSFVYDGLNRLLSQTNAQNGTTGFAYDRDGDIMSVTDAKQHQTSFTYDGMNRLVSRTDPLQHSDSRSYDYNSNLIKFVDRRGQSSTFSYDALDRLSGEHYEDGSSVARKYDANGRPVVIVDSLSGSFEFTYDPIGRFLSSANQFGAIQYTYDANSRIASRQVVGQSAVNYTYDNVSNLLSAAMPQASARFSYDHDNRLSNISRANGVTSQYSYDAASNLLSIIHSDGSGLNIPLIYTYNPVGERISYTTPVGQSLVTLAATSSYNANDQLTIRTDPSGTTSYTYDANGNLRSSTAVADVADYRWDTRNRLTSIQLPGDRGSSLLYDSGLNLIQRTDYSSNLSQTQTVQVDLSLNPDHFDSGNGDSLSFLNGLGVDQDIAGAPSSGVVEYSLKDGANSTIATTDARGTSVGHFFYEPFGQTTGVGTNYPFEFTGRTPFSSDLYYFRARYYSPSMGRFISEDPLQITGNGYKYANNNTASYSDPLGLASEQEENAQWYARLNSMAGSIQTADDTVAKYAPLGIATTFLALSLIQPEVAVFGELEAGTVLPSYGVAAGEGRALGVALSVLTQAVDLTQRYCNGSRFDDEGPDRRTVFLIDPLSIALALGDQAIPGLLLSLYDYQRTQPLVGSAVRHIRRGQ